MKDNIYFDNAATSWPKPESVYAYTDSFFRKNGVNPGRGGHAMLVEAEAMTFATRRMLAAFFGFKGDPNRVVFTLNATDSLNMAITGLLQPGDHVVTTRLEHNAVLRVCNHLVQSGDITMSQIQPGADGYIAPQDIEQAIQPNTRAILFNHASNVLGTVQPLEAVGQIAKANKVALIVDSAQTAGVIPIQMDQYGIDLLTFTGHKGLFGPMGIGGLIVSESIDLPPARFGGTGVDSISDFHPEIYPHRLEAGTVPLPGIAGLHAGQKWFRELGLQQQLVQGKPTGDDHGELCRLAQHYVHQTELSHIARIDAWLREIPGVTIIGNPRSSERVSLTSFVCDGMSAEQIGNMLDADHQVCVRAGLHCAPLVHVDTGTADSGGAVRISPGFFNDEDDMQCLQQALQDVLAP